MIRPTAPTWNAASPAALVLVDVIRDFEYRGAERLFGAAWEIAQAVAKFKRRARRRGIPSIYLNEADDRFRPSFSRQLARCLREGAPARPIAELLRPEKDDLFVLHSGQSASLPPRFESILQTLGVKTLIFTGLASSLCLLLTANDFYLSNLHLIVPADCLAASSEEEKERALAQVSSFLDIDTRPSVELEPALGLLAPTCRFSDTLS